MVVLQVMTSVELLVASWAGMAVLGLPCGPWFAGCGHWVAALHVVAVAGLVMLED